MTSTIIRVYADTSVFGGVFDEEFAEASAGFFAEVRTVAIHAPTEVVHYENEDI